MLRVEYDTDQHLVAVIDNLTANINILDLPCTEIKRTIEPSLAIFETGLSRRAYISLFSMHMLEKRRLWRSAWLLLFIRSFECALESVRMVMDYKVHNLLARPETKIGFEPTQTFAIPWKTFNLGLISSSFASYYSVSPLEITVELPIQSFPSIYVVLKGPVV